MSLQPDAPTRQRNAARIAFILPNLAGGGAERMAMNVMGSLLDHGHQVDLVLGRAEGELLQLVPREVAVFDLEAARFRNMLSPLIRYFRDESPDAVQARMWPLTVLVVIAHRLSGRPGRLVLSDHAALSKQFGGSKPRMAALRITTRLFYPAADARICVSKGVADDLARLSGLSRGMFTVVYNPVVPPRPMPSVPIEVEQLWPAGRRILTVGSLKEQKNQELLVRAFAQAAERTPASLMILGEGALRDRLERLAGELGVSDRVVLPGFAPDPWPYYRSADLFVLSSDYEGFGNVLTEALNAGLNVVSTDCESGPREILDGGRYGRLVPVGDTERLARAMIEGLDEPIPPGVLQHRAEELSSDSLETYRRLLLGGEHE